MLKKVKLKITKKNGRKEAVAFPESIINTDNVCVAYPNEVKGTYVCLLTCGETVLVQGKITELLKK